MQDSIDFFGYRIIFLSIFLLFDYFNFSSCNNFYTSEAVRWVDSQYLRLISPASWDSKVSLDRQLIKFLQVSIRHEPAGCCGEVSRDSHLLQIINSVLQVINLAKTPDCHWGCQSLRSKSCRRTTYLRCISRCPMSGSGHLVGFYWLLLAKTLALIMFQLWFVHHTDGHI